MKRYSHRYSAVTRKYIVENNMMILYIICCLISINIHVNLLISGKLCRPPSSVHCFRDITLYAHVFTDLQVLLTCESHNKDRNWRWLKQHGAFDYVQDIIEYDQEPGILLSPRAPCSLRVDRLTEPGLNRIITYLNVYTSG